MKPKFGDIGHAYHFYCNLDAYQEHFKTQEENADNVIKVANHFLSLAELTKKSAIALGEDASRMSSASRASELAKVEKEKEA